MRIFGYEIKASIDRSESSRPSASLARVSPTIISPWEDKREIYSPENYRQLIDMYKSWIYVCASKNSNSVATAPLRLYVGKQSKESKILVKTVKLDKQKTERIRKQGNLIPYHRKAVEIEEVIEHPFLDMIKIVNPLLTRFDLWDATQLWLELTGNAFWYIYKDRLGVPSELWPLPPQWMRIVGSKETIIAGYVYQRNVAKIPFESDEIVHFKFYSPTGSLYGTGPLAAIMDAAIDDKNIKVFESTLMKNMGRPEGVLQSTEAISEVDFNRIKSRWRQNYGGQNKVGQTLILENGLTYTPLTFTPREMNYVVGRKLNREEIAAAFGVPMSKLTTESVNLANAYVGEHQYMQDTIEPRLRRIEESINEKLMPMYDENLFIAYDPVVPSDKEFELKERTSNLLSYITTVNEEREKMGLEEVEWGKIPLAPAGIAPLGSQAAAPGAPGSEGTPVIPGEEELTLEGALEEIPPEEIPGEKQTRDVITRIIQRVREKLSIPAEVSSKL